MEGGRTLVEIAKQINGPLNYVVQEVYPFLRFRGSSLLSFFFYLLCFLFICNFLFIVHL